MATSPSVLRYRNPDQPWVEAWQDGTPTTDAEAIAWIRSRPAPIKALMRMFPPSCLVVATRPLLMPRAGVCGVVASYFEGGTLTVIDHPTEAVARAECEVEWLTVVGYYRGMDLAWMAEILEGK